MEILSETQGGGQYNLSHFSLDLDYRLSQNLLNFGNIVQPGFCIFGLDNCATLCKKDFPPGSPSRFSLAPSLPPLRGSASPGSQQPHPSRRKSPPAGNADPPPHPPRTHRGCWSPSVH